MTNCLAPYSESNGIYKAYQSNNMLDTSIGFVIPVYENMPKYATESPNILASDYQADSTKVYADVSGNLNIRCGPGTSYEIVGQVTKVDIMTRIRRGVQSGERWDKVELSNGMVGYVFQSYVKEVPKVSITSINLSIDNNVIDKGSTNSIKIEVLPQDAENKDQIIWSSSNDSVLIVDNKGIITGVSSGTAKITAKTIDGSVSNSIDITVFTTAAEISISKTEATILLGKTLKLNANVLPEDASNKNIVWSSQNQEIASVDQTGLVNAVSEGTTKIIVKTEDGKIQRECGITVKQITQDETIEFDDSLKQDGDEISGINVDKNTVADIKGLIVTNLNSQIYNKDNKLLEDTDSVGTGTKIVLIDGEGNEIYSYSVVIYGDLNGDGKINSLDVLVLQKHILETKQIEGLFLKAGNISKNGNLPSSLDVLKMQKHILESKFIEQ